MNIDRNISFLYIRSIRKRNVSFGGGILNKKRNKMIEFRSNQSRLIVAKNLKITPQMLGAIERGDRTPSLELAKRIADFYKTTIDNLFFS